MKNIKLVIILVAGLALGWIGQSIFYQINALGRPLVQEGKIDISGLISSIKDSIDLTKVNDSDQKYRRLDDIFSLLDENYFDQAKLNSGAMIKSAAKALVDAISDPYTIYMDNVEQSGFDNMLKGEEDFEGIGAVVSKKDYYVVIEEVLKDSPAAKAGLRQLDRIIYINTGSVKDLDINEAVRRIKGPKGTEVILTIERHDRKNKDKKEILEIKVIRDKLVLPSVSSKILTGNSGQALGYLNITVIGEETENILKTQILELKSKNVKGIILDLRGNGGGFLPIAVQISSHFVPKDKIIVSAKYRRRDEETYKSFGYGDLEGFPVVVLVNQMTASAGEIIAMALQEQIGAKLIGSTTFGKGSIQTLDKFDDGDSIKYTIGKRYSPSGKNIDETGVSPDVGIEFDADAYVDNRFDNQLDQARIELDKMIK